MVVSFDDGLDGLTVNRAFLADRPFLEFHPDPPKPLVEIILSPLTRQDAKVLLRVQVGRWVACRVCDTA